MSNNEAIQEVVDKNFEAFRKRLPDLLKTHPNEFALLRNGEVAEFFDTAKDAVVYGQKRSEDGMFSVQKVASAVADLGFYSRAMR